MRLYQLAGLAAIAILAVGGYWLDYQIKKAAARDAMIEAAREMRVGFDGTKWYPGFAEQEFDGFVVRRLEDGSMRIIEKSGSGTTIVNPPLKPESK